MSRLAVEKAETKALTIRRIIWEWDLTTNQFYPSYEFRRAPSPNVCHVVELGRDVVPRPREESGAHP